MSGVVLFLDAPRYNVPELNMLEAMLQEIWPVHAMCGPCLCKVGLRTLVAALDSMDASL